VADLEIINIPRRNAWEHVHDVGEIRFPMLIPIVKTIEDAF
jgi:hypothetical protein